MGRQEGKGSDVHHHCQILCPAAFPLPSPLPSFAPSLPPLCLPTSPLAYLPWWVGRDLVLHVGKLWASSQSTLYGCFVAANAGRIACSAKRGPSIFKRVLRYFTSYQNTLFFYETVVIILLLTCNFCMATPYSVSKYRNKIDQYILSRSSWNNLLVFSLPQTMC